MSVFPHPFPRRSPLQSSTPRLAAPSAAAAARLPLTMLATFVLSLAAAVAAAAWPQTALAAGTRGSGKSATESRSVPDFQAIALSGSMDLNVRQGPVLSLQVQADDNLLPLLETVVENHSNGPTLQVRWKKDTYIQTRTPVLVTVVMPRLTALAASGSGDLRVESFNTPALKLSITGSGDARLTDLTAGELGISISGSGDVGASGSATRLKVSIAGSGDVRLADLKAEDVSVAIAGSGDAAVNASKTLDVRIAGSGDVTYTGSASVKSTVAGSGSVNKR